MINALFSNCYSLTWLKRVSYTRGNTDHSKCNRLSITVDKPELDKEMTGIKINMTSKSIGLVSGPDVVIFELKKPRNRPKTRRVVHINEI